MSEETIKKKYREQIFNIRFALYLAKTDEDITKLKSELKQTLQKMKKEICEERMRENDKYKRR